MSTLTIPDTLSNRARLVASDEFPGPSLDPAWTPNAPVSFANNTVTLTGASGGYNALTRSLGTMPATGFDVRFRVLQQGTVYVRLNNGDGSENFGIDLNPGNVTMIWTDGGGASHPLDGASTTPGAFGSAGATYQLGCTVRPMLKADTGAAYLAVSFRLTNTATGGGLQFYWEETRPEMQGGTYQLQIVSGNNTPLTVSHYGAYALDQSAPAVPGLLDLTWSKVNLISNFANQRLVRKLDGTPLFTSDWSAVYVSGTSTVDGYCIEAINLSTGAATVVSHLAFTAGGQAATASIGPIIQMPDGSFLGLVTNYGSDPGNTSPWLPSFFTTTDNLLGGNAATVHTYPLTQLPLPQTGQVSGYDPDLTTINGSYYLTYARTDRYTQSGTNWNFYPVCVKVTAIDAASLAQAGNYADVWTEADQRFTEGCQFAAVGGAFTVQGGLSKLAPGTSVWDALSGVPLGAVPFPSFQAAYSSHVSVVPYEAIGSPGNTQYLLLAMDPPADFNSGGQANNLYVFRSNEQRQGLEFAGIGHQSTSLYAFTMDPRSDSTVSASGLITRGNTLGTFHVTIEKTADRTKTGVLTFTVASS